MKDYEYEFGCDKCMDELYCCHDDEGCCDCCGDEDGYNMCLDEDDYNDYNEDDDDDE